MRPPDYKRALLFFILFILIILSCGSGQERIASDDSTDGLTPVDTSLVDAEVLDRLVTDISSGRYGEVHSVLISRRGKLVFERYFRGYSRDQLHAVYSVTKSVVSALIGIAVDRGDIDGVELKVLDLFPQYTGQIANLDSLKESISIKNLLTMSAGLKWDEWTFPYSDPRNDINKMYPSGDWVKYILDLPMTDVPGSRVVYNSGASILLSAILTDATGLSAGEYSSTFLFGQLGITTWVWQSPPYHPEISIGGWGLFLRPIDMIKFGQLYLQSGRWNDTQVISEDWVGESTRPWGRLSEAYDYGYQWWRYSDWVLAEGLLDINDVFMAVGRGGQYIWVVPHLETVAVSTAWNDNNGKSSWSMFLDYVLPAVKNKQYRR